MTHAEGQQDIQDGFSTKSDPMPPQNAGWGVDMRDKLELSNKIHKIREKGTYKGVSYDYRIETPHGTFYWQDSLAQESAQFLEKKRDEYKLNCQLGRFNEFLLEYERANDFPTKAIDRL